ncbi:MAG TPA: pyridoxamine 5'-phosphate oxidase family protein [Flavisolibacter sp.]|nr:pyridoxamine 5'-phosphate oxidase family protein [Flavisolibacter sp.]
MEKNLSNEEALKKFKKLVNEINVCMFITNNQDGDHTRPMATVEVEENGTLWFFTDIRSVKVEEISMNRSAHLVYAHPGKESYLDVWGEASVITDKQTKKDKWTPVIKAWFPNGVDDPNLALLKVQPQNVYYWDAEAGKMVSFLKIIAGAITAQPALSSDAQGSLKV